jgi:predicted permease
VASLLSIFASDLLPVFLVAGAGFLLARRLGVDVRALSKVAFNALAPCLVFATLVASPMDGREFGAMALFCVLAMAVMGASARLAGAVLGLDRPALSGLLLVVMFSNGGNYGLPVVLFAFGPEALSHATVYFVTSAVLAYTAGVLVAASGHRSVVQAVVGIARVPAVYGFLAAVAVLATGVGVPLPVMRPITLLSDAALPVMMLVLGMQLERATVPERPRVVAVAVVLCLLLAPVVALGLTWAMGMDGAARQAAVIQASMPAAVVTTELALECEVAPAFVTSVVFVPTVLSPLTLAPLIAFRPRR